MDGPGIPVYGDTGIGGYSSGYPYSGLSVTLVYGDTLT